MKKIIFLFCVLFSTLSFEAAAITAAANQQTTETLTPSVKEHSQTKKQLNGIAWVFLGAAVLCLILAVTIFTVPLAKLIMSIVGLGFAIFGLIYTIKASKTPH